MVLSSTSGSAMWIIFVMDKHGSNPFFFVFQCRSMVFTVFVLLSLLAV